MNNVQSIEDTLTNNNEPLALSVDEAADAILARWEKDAAAEEASKPSTPDETEAALDIEQEETTDVDELEDLEEVTDEDDEEQTDRSNEEPDDDEDTEEDESEDDADDTEAEVLADDAKVEVVVNGETKTVSVKALKRLYGQEASLTQKSQRVAEQRKELDDAIGKNHIAFQKMLEKANERYKPYSEVDMLVASKAMETEDFAALRKEAEEAYNELKFLQEEADAFYSDVKNQQQANLQKAAKECVKVLQEEVPDWSNKLYNDIRTYAVEQGLPEEDVNNYVDPKVIMLINKARLYDAGKKIATTKKKSATTKKTLRSTKAPEPEKQRKQAKLNEAKLRLKSSGNDLDDIAEALLSRWEA